ncbi:MAG: energy transducer TonB [Acidobacteria bacterium]|nr:energy transducer TonB [Acidobacteriota bacterium]MDA1235476.1 energy transducer TonB [Acidobacteriota bacterium]
MFQQSIHSAEDSRRPWTFSVSLLVQALFIAIAVLIPLLAEPMLPMLNAAIVSLQLPKPPRASAPPPPQQVVAVRPETFKGELRQPTQIPARVAPIVDAPPPSVELNRIGVVGASPGPSDALINTLTNKVRVAPPPAPEPAPVPEAEPTPISVGGTVQAARIVRRVQPIYPPLARTARISGIVRLQAIIAADGTIAELNVISGHPMLIAAAVDAVKQWRYRPTVLNGKPVPVNTQIDVNFTLGR